MQFCCRRYISSSYDVRSPCSNASDFLLRQPVDYISLSSHQDPNVNFLTRCIEQPSPATVPHSQCTFDLEQMRDLEESDGSPYVAGVNCGTDMPYYGPETDTTTRIVDSGYNSPIQIPYKFDHCLYHLTSSTTSATSIRDSHGKADAYRDLLDYWENVCDDGSSTGSDRDDVVYTSRLQTLHRNCSAVSNISTSNKYNSRQLGLPHHRSDEEYKPMTSFQMFECLDISGSSTHPPQTTRSSTYTPAMNSVSRQTYASAHPEQFASLMSASKMQLEPEYQQSNRIISNQPQASCIDNEDHATFGTLHGLDFPEDVIPTSSLKARNTTYHNRAVTTPDLSDTAHISTSLEYSRFCTISSPLHVFSLGRVAEAQTACRRQLFGDDSRYQKDSDYRVCTNSQQEQSWFQQSRPPTSCAVSENEHDTKKPFLAAGQLDYSRQSASTISEIDCETCPYVMPEVRRNHEECTPLTNSSPSPVFATGDVGKTQTWSCCQLFDDAGCYVADGGYRVRRNIQEHHDSFQNCPPQILCAVAFGEDTTTFNCVKLSDCSRALSKGGADKAHSVCRRRLFGDSRYYRADGGYRVRKRSASATTVHRCDLCDRTYTRPSSLRDHVRARHSTAPKPHVCSICGRRFTQLSNLDAHRRTHTGLYTDFVHMPLSLDYACLDSLHRTIVWYFTIDLRA